MGKFVVEMFVHTTPAPSVGPQLSEASCGQSNKEFSLPLQFTLSMTKLEGTRPKCDLLVVFVADENLQMENMNIPIFEKN